MLDPASTRLRRAPSGFERASIDLNLKFCGSATSCRNIENGHVHQTSFHRICASGSSVGWFWTPVRVIFDEESERKRILATLCKTKCSGMDLKNHKTAYYALQKLQPPHRDNLKRLGYGVPPQNCEKHRMISPSKSSVLTTVLAAGCL